MKEGCCSTVMDLQSQSFADKERVNISCEWDVGYMGERESQWENHLRFLPLGSLEEK